MAMAAAATAIAASAQQYVPAVKVGTAALISPSAAETYYGASSTSTNGIGAVTRPPEIIELARALRNNPDLIYEYVRNNIDIVWMYGLHKGALGASIDKAGTSFDQAALMIELLRQAGYTATYKHGTITLTGSQFTAWTGIADAKAACQLLANGGIPGAVNGTSDATCNYGTGTPVSSVELAHVWVSVTISGTAYVFDPAYKTHAWKTGINLASAMGLTPGQALSQSLGGTSTGTTSGVGYVRNFNSEALYTTLTGYATNLLTYLQANNLNDAELEDIVSGGKIEPFVSPAGGLRQGSLPYTSTALKTWTGNVPDQYRTTLKVLGTMMNFQSSTFQTMFDRTFYTDEIYGRRLTLDTDYNYWELNATSQWVATVRLKVDGVMLATYSNTSGSGFTTRGAASRMSLTANHPYAASSDGTSTVDGTYMDTSVTKPIDLVTSATIVHGWGDTGGDLFSKWDQEVPHDTALAFRHHYTRNAQNEPQVPSFVGSTGDNTRTKSAAMWLGQYTRAARLHAAVAKSVVQLHHAIGIVYAHTSLAPDYAGNWTPVPPPDFLLKDSFDRIDIDSGFSVTSKSADAVTRRAAVHAIAATAAALEGSIAAQMADVPDTASVASRFEWGNRPVADTDPYAKGVRDFMEFTSANASAAATVAQMEGRISGNDGAVPAFQPMPVIGDTEMQIWRANLAEAINDYAQAGFTVAASRDSFLAPGQRGGPYWAQSTTPTPRPGDPIGAFIAASKQRGGALVATKYVGGEPVEIAHATLTRRLGGGTIITKGGGGGIQPDAAGKYSPETAADALKARFVDRSNVLGVNLSNGSFTYESPAKLDVGNGEFPYKLAASFSYRAGAGAPGVVSAPVMFEPRPGWNSNWNNKLSISGSGHEAMGSSDIRAAVGAIAAFAVAQDVYKAAPSLSREVVGVLTQSWWIKQLSGNVVTATLGTSSRQFVRLFNNSWISTGGGHATLVQTGTRVVFEDQCPTPTGQLYQLSRAWNNSGLSFAITNANGDVQNFAYWRNYYKDGADNAIPCMSAQGFRLTTWTFPQGPTVTLVYGGSTPASTYPVIMDRLLEVNNTLGRKLVFTGAENSDTQWSKTVNDGNTPARSVSVVTAGLGNGDSTHTDPVGNVTKFTFQADVVASATTRPRPWKVLGRVFTADNATKANLEYVYDGISRVKEINDATAIQLGGRAPYQFFIADGTRGERVDPAGGSFVVTYDTNRRPWRYTDEIGRVTQAFYDGRGRVTRYIYPELDEELLEYDDRNNPTKFTRKPKPSSCTPTCPAVQEVTAAWHATWNKPIWVKDQLLRQSDFSYYETGNGKSLMATALRPAVGATRPQYSFTYDAKGMLLTSTDPTGLVAQNTYHATNGNLLSSILDPGTSPHVAATTVYAYDVVGNVTQVTDPRGNISTTTYNANRQKLVEIAYLGTTTASPLGSAMRTTYNAVGHVITEERATAFAGATPTYGHVTQFAYTPTGQQSQVTDADSRVTRMQYDGADRLVVTIDPEARRVRKVYDLAGQLLQEVRADSSPLQQVYAEHSYTPNGKEAWIKDAKGNQTTYTYDGFDRLVRTTFPDTTYEDLAYDTRNNVLSKLTRGAQLIVNTYDTLDRLSTHLVPQPGGAPAILTTTAYDLAGRTTQVSDSAGHILAYAFDSAKRPASVTQTAPGVAGTRVVAYQFDKNGNKTRATWADGYYVQYGYDQLNRMTTASENGTFVLATYVYNPLSRRTSLVTGNGKTQAYTYSTQGDLLTLAHTLTSTNNTYTNTFTKAHQLASENVSNAAWRYVPSAFQTTNYSPANALNQYVNVTVGANPAVTMAYDANGNLTGDGTWTFAYDAENKLKTANKSGTAASYAYDPLGRRQAKTVNAALTTFVSDGDEEIAEYDGAATLLRRFVPGPATDQPIAMVTPNGASNTRRYFHTNRQGSVVAMSADNGTIAEGPYTYDVYGNGAPTTGVPFKFTGRRLDPETGLYYYRARYYSPSLGRFLQVDPVGYADQMNLYAYGDNDPTNKNDPTGKFWGLVGKVIKVAIKGGDIASTIAGAAEDLGTLTSADASVGDRVLAGLSLASEVFSPVSGRDIKAGANFVETALKTCCFVAGTLVATDDGLRAIETIKVGDLVLSRDEATGKTAFKPVTDLIRRHDRIIWKLTLSVPDENDSKKFVTAVFETTDDHPWRTTLGTWVKTMDLRPGIEIQRARGPPAKIVSVENTRKGQPTFNLEVADFHTYFVGHGQVWVHNANHCGEAVLKADKVGSLPKPPTGPGSVPKADRDPKRVWTPSERAAKREEQGGKCASDCGTDIDASNSRGHHVERHADGGKTDDANHVEVCVDCHNKLHSR